MENKNKKGTMQLTKEAKKNLQVALDNAEITKEVTKSITNILDRFKL